MNKIDLENMIDEAYKLHEDHKDDQILTDNFNACQMLYHDLFDVWYIPARKAVVEYQEPINIHPFYD